MASGRLAPGVADHLIGKEDYVHLMQHPKVAAAIQKLKTDPNCLPALCAADDELADLFAKLQAQMSAAEAEYGVDDGARRSTGARAVAAGPGGSRIFEEDDDAPPLLSPVEAEAEEARARGSKAFAAGHFVDACMHYERACDLEPSAHLHFSNLAAARLKCGRLRLALEAAQQCIRLAPRFAKGYLRCGQALQALGDKPVAADVLEQGLQRAEGSVRQAIASALDECGGPRSKRAADAVPVKPAAQAKPAAPPKAKAPAAKPDEPRALATPVLPADGIILGNGHIFDIL